MLAHALHRLGAAFTYRDFRVLWLGAFTSTVGTWTQRVAQNWLVLTLTGSAFYLGLDSFLGELPVLLFTLIGGVIADRHDRRYLLVGSQCGQMASAFILAALVYFDVIEVWHILVLSFVSGCAQAFGGPAYQSLLPALVPKQHLPNAIALNSIQFNLARVIGPLIAGVALTAIGTAACFGMNGLSFLVVIVALLSLKVKHLPPPTRQRMMDELRGGLSYVRHQGSLAALTSLAFATTFLGLPLLTLLPVIAQDVFQQGVGQYSKMMAFSGAGAVVGALVVAWLGKFRHMGRTLLIVQIVFGALIVAFSLSRVILLSEVLLFFAGSMLIMVFSLVTSLVQLVAPDELRGRVMSIFMVSFRGGIPLGNLAAGFVASRVSAPFVLTVNGALLASVACVFLLTNPGVRRL
ncbi:MAG: MFS transporter [Vicinamibacterales bacterium]|nr:MFS transporter [Vicinamibacterales bacterium]MDP7691952.1 MFS transporter [Vicinamibacterales bacterium]HJN44868.1 MFS transporter [Vicinamibacterales bacterium]